MQFVNGYASGRKAADTAGKPMLVFFTAEWCHYCHQMKDTTLAHPDVVSLSDQFVCVLVDADQEPDVCRSFDVSGYPTVQFVSARGVPLNRVIGSRAPHLLLREMRAALQAIARRFDIPGEPTRR